MATPGHPLAFLGHASRYFFSCETKYWQKGPIIISSIIASLLEFKSIPSASIATALDLISVLILYGFIDSHFGLLLECHDDNRKISAG